MQDQAVLFVNSAPQVPLRSLTKYTLPNGSHSVMVVPVSMSFDDVAAAVRMHMAQNGYKLTERYGEMVWKKGTGVATAMHFIKVEYAPGYAIMHGWVQSGIGKAGMNDMSLDGFMGAIPKSTCKQVILDLAGKLR